MHSFIRAVHLLAAGLTLIALAGCGGDSSSESPPASSAGERTLTLSATSVQAGNGTVTITVPSNISHGVLTWTASIGAVTVAGDNSATYTPPTTLASTAVAAISATDGASAPLTAAITVTPSAILSVTPAVSVTSAAGSPVSLTATVTNSAQTAGAVHWAITSGHGTLSAATGSTVSYKPDPSDTAPNATAVVTATLGAISQTAMIRLNFSSTARFNFPIGTAVDASGNIYVADLYNHIIRKIALDGTVSTLAGKAGEGSEADGTGSNARFNGPYGLATSPDGSIYVTDAGSCRVRKVTPAGVVTTIAGGTCGYVDATGTSAQFFQPAGVAVDVSGNILVADLFNSRIRKINPDGVVTTVAGSGNVEGYNDGPASTAVFSYPSSLAIDASGNIYIADTGNCVIRLIDTTGMVSTIAGVPSSCGHADGAASAALFDSPFGIVLDGGGNLYVTEPSNHTIRKISGTTVSTMAGAPAPDSIPGSSDGLGTAARFNGPSGISVDRTGTLYLTDSYNNEIRMVSPAGLVTTIAGSASESGDADGLALPRN